MRLKVIAPIIIITAALAGCSAPDAAPATTATTVSTAQVASAVAKSRPQLDAAMNRFESENCVTTIQAAKNGVAVMDCVDALTKTGALARVMQKDLESVRPWSEETRALADETISQLEKMSIASNYGDGKPWAAVTSQMGFLRTQLQAWKPFGA